MQRCIAVRFRLRCVFIPNNTAIGYIFTIFYPWYFGIWLGILGELEELQINNQYENRQMNAKSKKYYQDLCDVNKQNILLKPSKSKQNSQKEISKAGHNHSAKTHNLLAHLQHKSLTGQHTSSINHHMSSIPGIESKKNIISKCIKETQQHGINIGKECKDKVMKLPKINKDDCTVNLGMGKRRHSRSYKKILTQPQECHEEDSVHLRTLSPKQSMKEVLMSIVKNKETRHLASIDQEIDKLQTLTKRYSCLRKDLVSIQQDILTISFKQKCRQRGKETSESSSTVFM